GRPRTVLNPQIECPHPLDPAFNAAHEAVHPIEDGLETQADFEFIGHMPLVGLVVLIGGLVALCVLLPVALALAIAAAQWAWSSGFAATLLVALVIVGLLLLADPRERRR